MIGNGVKLASTTVSPAETELKALGRSLGAQAPDLVSVGDEMTTEKPTGEFVNEMTSKGAWPEADENLYSQRATELRGILSKLGNATGSWDEARASIFNSSTTWVGLGANAADGESNLRSQAMSGLMAQLETVITSHEDAVSAITLRVRVS